MNWNAVDIFVINTAYPRRFIPRSLSDAPCRETVVVYLAERLQSAGQCVQHMRNTHKIVNEGKLTTSRLAGKVRIFPSHVK